MRCVLLVIVLYAGCAFGQAPDSSSTPSVPSQPIDSAAASTQSQPSGGTVTAPGSPAQPANPSQASAPAGVQTVPAAQQQPKRIFGVMPNFRAVSAGATLPPPTPKLAFKIATANSFDYSTFLFVGMASAIREGTNADPSFGKGVNGFGQYYWRGMLDKTTGNYLVIWVLPTVFHQDERYFALSKGSFMKRTVYAVSRVVITRNYEGQSTFNTSEILGRGGAEAISLAYYPSSSRTASAALTKYGYALLRDAWTNAFREFWPDIATHVLHRHP